MQMMKEHKKGETVKELALRLSITKAHVYNLLRSGRLPGKKYEDGSWLVTDEDIDQWLASIKKKVNRSAYYNRKYKKTEHKGIWFSEETGKYKVLVRTHEYDGIVGIYDTLEEALLIRQKVLAENSPMERPVDNIYSEDEISAENVAKQFHVDTSTIYRYIRDGFLKARKNNGFWIIAKKDVPLLKKQLEDQDAQVSKKTFLKKGDRIGCWTILEPVKGMTTSGVWKSECQCICGKIKLVNIESLEEKRALSCGCKKAEYFHLRKIQKAGEQLQIPFEIPSYPKWLLMDERMNEEAPMTDEGIVYIPKLNKYLPVIKNHKGILTRLCLKDTQEEAQKELETAKAIQETLPMEQKATKSKP